MREAALALGITRWRAVVGVVYRGDDGDYHRDNAGGCTYRRGTAPLLFTALGSSFGLQGLLKPIGSLSLLIYHYALSAL